MRFKIKGATVENIAALIKNFSETNDLTFDVANIYINFHKEGHAVVACMETDNQDGYEKIDSVLCNYDDCKNLEIFGKRKLRFIRATEYEAAREKYENERVAEIAKLQEKYRQESRERYRLSQIGWLGLGRRIKDGLYKFYKVNSDYKPGKDFADKKKEKYGYEVIDFIHTEQLDNLEEKLKKLWYTQDKCVKGYYKLDDNDITQFRLLGEQNKTDEKENKHE